MLEPEPPPEMRLQRVDSRTSLSPRRRLVRVDAGEGVPSSY
jgi:hypothetical protein